MATFTGKECGGSYEVGETLTVSTSAAGRVLLEVSGAIFNSGSRCLGTRLESRQATIDTSAATGEISVWLGHTTGYAVAVKISEPCTLTPGGSRLPSAALAQPLLPPPPPLAPDAAERIDVSTTWCAHECKLLLHWWRELDQLVAIEVRWQGDAWLGVGVSPDAKMIGSSSIIAQWGGADGPTSDVYVLNSKRMGGVKRQMAASSVEPTRINGAATPPAPLPHPCALKRQQSMAGRRLDAQASAQPD